MLNLVLKTVIMYSSLLLLMRLIGKRQLGELELSELVVTILISEMAAGPLTQKDLKLWEGLVPLVTLMVIDYLLSLLTLKSVKLRGIFSGKPAMLIVRGRIDQSQMRKNRFTPDELTEALRTQGILDLHEIEYAVLETDGTLNVIQTPENRPVTAGQMGLSPEDAGYPLIVINGGRVMTQNLRILGKDEKWLEKALRSQKIQSPKDVYLMTCDANGGIFLAPME